MIHVLTFHEDGVNWGDFTLRKTLYDPDQANGDPLSNMDPNHFFNLPISEIKNRFNAEIGETRKKIPYDEKNHSFITNEIHRLCKKAGISMMSVVQFNTDKIGASTSPGIEIDVSSGAIEKLNKSELKALLAHEVAHSIIHAKRINTENEETAADVIGARLSSKDSMIHLIEYFEKHVNVASTGDEAHYSDPKRIAEIKQSFKEADAKLRQINHLKSQVQITREKNEHYRKLRELKQRLAKTEKRNQELKKQIEKRKNYHLK